ncbi:MAG: OmpA family protein [Sulfuricurvum sp.]|nr:OmpA family protein [Sulfuricurvum sp.]
MKLLILTLTLSSALFAGVYDYGYHPSKDVVSSEQKNPLFYGDFERILRYEAIPYVPSDPVKLEETPYIGKMYESLQSYVSSGVPYKVSIVGHTRLNEESEHERAQESTFFGSIQNSLFESKSDASANRAACERAVAAVKKQLIDHKVKEDDIVAECRDGANPHYLENDGDAREMNHRVLVTLYTAKVEKKGEPVQVPAVALAVAPKAVPVVIPALQPIVVAAEMDSDRDGVVDSQDKCPNTPKGYVVDDNGCPVAVTLHINFATSSYAIPASASKEIEKLKGFMKEYQGYTIDISGHTDSMGKSDKNQRLSENRAKALAKVLVKGGIAADRIKTQGFGESQPIASNIKAVGRAQNRRVEVKMFANPKNN